MRCGLLYSAGKDSTLAALLLEPFYDVTLVTGTFGIVDPEPAREAADAIGFEHRTIDLDPDVADAAVEQMYDDGYPRNGIQQVHEHAVEEVATAEWTEAVADGTRRDDRVPTVDRPLAQSIKDRFGVDYLAPLAGIGRDAVDQLTESLLVIRQGPTEEIDKGDYEIELRTLVEDTYGQDAVGTVFPDHTQSRVIDRE
jgi:predicted subunit of tRNA(5-methylaminomethyl-2-thiouridylate) methyltransferase